MGACISRPDEGNTNDRQSATRAKPQPLRPYIGGRRFDNRAAHSPPAHSSPEFSTLATDDQSAAAASERPSIIVTAATPSADVIVPPPRHLPTLEWEPHASSTLTYSPTSIEAAQADPSQSSTRKNLFIESSLLSSFRGDSSSSLSATPVTMSDSGTTRTLLRSSRTVSFAPSVISFTQVPQAPPASPVTSVPTPMCDWTWEALRVELRAVALQQVEEMILIATRSRNPLSSEIIDAFIELDSCEYASPHESTVADSATSEFLSSTKITQNRIATATSSFEVTALVDGYVHNTMHEKKLRRKPS